MIFYKLIYKYMKKLYTNAIKAYLELLEIHINTKTTDIVFHRETEKFYEKLFEISHNLWEKYVDLGWNLREDKESLEQLKLKTFEIISSLKKEIENYKKTMKFL